MARTTIRTADITDAAVTGAKLEGGAVDTSGLEDDIALLGFKVASNGSLAKYNLVDQTVDDFQDASGVNTGTSTNEIRHASNYYSGVGITDNANYWGDSSDGALTTSGNVTFTPTNINGSYDADMVVKQYSSLTVSAGHTMTVSQPCRGMFIYVAGDCEIAGTLSMSKKGAAADPTASGGSDSNAVGASGLQIGLRTASGSTSFTNDGTGFNGSGTGIRTAIANQSNLSSNGVVFSIPRDGGAGGDWGPPSADSVTDGVIGGTVANGTGGGSTGSGSWSASQTSTSGNYANGGKGGCFGGGSGGGGMSGSGGNSAAVVEGTNALDYGFRGGNGVQDTGHGNSCVEGGAGNPTGIGQCAGALCSSCNVDAADGYGGGGIIWLLVKGDLTISGTIECNGSRSEAGATAVNHASGSSGGGALVMLYAGTLSNTGTLSVAGGAGQAGPGAHASTLAGGAGATQSSQVLLNETVYNDMTLVSATTAAQAAPTKGDIVLTYTNGAGSTTLDTDLTAEISADGGSTWTALALGSEGSTGAHNIATSHDVTISSTITAPYNMAYRIKTLNQSVSKTTRIQAVSLGWS